MIKGRFTLDIFTFFRHNISLKIIGGESKSVTPEMISSWNETTLPTILSNYKLEDILSLITWKERNVPEERKAKLDLLEWQQEVRQEKNCPCLWSENLKNPTVSKMSSTYPVNTNRKRRVGWIVRSLKSGSVKSIGSFVQMIGKCSKRWQLSSPPSNSKLDQRATRIFAP